MDSPVGDVPPDAPPSPENAGGGGGEEDSARALGDQIAALRNPPSGTKPGDASDNIVVGAFEEIGRIEWPTPIGALKTTGIVIAIVTGSAVVLLTVNSALSSVSRAVFG